MTDPALLAVAVVLGAALTIAGYWTAEGVRQWRHRERCRRRRAMTPLARPASDVWPGLEAVKTSGVSASEWQPGSFTFPGVFEPPLPRESMSSIPDALTAQSPKETL